MGRVKPGEQLAHVGSHLSLDPWPILHLKLILLLCAVHIYSLSRGNLTYFLFLLLRSPFTY